METLRSVSCAIALRINPRLRKKHNANLVDLQGITQVREATYLASGAYNSIFLIKLHKPLEVSEFRSKLSPPARRLQFEHALIPHCADPATNSPGVDQFVLRLPFEDALLPNRITNDVAFRRFVATKLPHIPVPQVFYYQATSQSETSFIVEEFIPCSPISSTWMSLGLAQKHSLAYALASIFVDLAELRFDLIGGLNPNDWSSAPTVEGSKLFKGRYKFHQHDCYHIGPYKSTKEYVLASYDKEIYYYTHANEDIDMAFFDNVTICEFVQRLRRKRAALAEAAIVDEPFVLAHGDFHGRNILAQGERIVAVLDWDFAGSYPLSELLSGGDIDVVDADSEELDEENTVWGQEIRHYIRHVVTERCWDKTWIDLLMGSGDPELGEVRVEMVP
ncbi:hypothetical protein NUW58_g857 [Xylaria curta]|uniref:Uncharacterized protein n=1 Tax=Xylaria curta TaxID=42375 RepID=A0ACC1PN73_9PEZI|nr:hypothetical protein NUW58_g857 [Xylaria curta]